MRFRFPFFVIVAVLALSLAGCTLIQPSPTPVVVTPCPTCEACEVCEAAEPCPQLTPQPTYTPAPTYTPRPTYTPLPTYTPQPTYTPFPTNTPAFVAATASASRPTRTPAPTWQAATAVPPVSAPSVVSSGAVEILPDPNPAPPLTVIVSANQLLEGYHHKVSGFLRNDSSENYTGLGVVATFYMSDGRRYGPIKVDAGCLLIAPGDVCPFVVEATSKNLVSVVLHPEGRPTDRGRAPVTVSVTGHSRDSVGYVHITGWVKNDNPFTIKNTTVTGALLDAAGAVVSVDSVVVIEMIDPGQSAAFEVMIPYVSYSSYQVYAQAEPK